MWFQKGLAAQVRVPTRTREDVVNLDMVCWLVQIAPTRTNFRLLGLRWSGLAQGLVTFYAIGR